MNKAIVVSIAIMLAMIAQVVPAMACGGGQNCDVVVPECRGCYTMTAQAELQSGPDGVSVGGSSTALKDKVGTTTEVGIAADGGTLSLEVGSMVSNHPADIITYSIFGGNTGQNEADIILDSTGVVRGSYWHPCVVNVDTNLEVETVKGTFDGYTNVHYGLADPSDGLMKELTAAQVVNGKISTAIGNAEANNNKVPGTVYVGVDISPSQVVTYAGATFYMMHFGNDFGYGFP